MQMVGELLGIVDQFQGVDVLEVEGDGSLKILERVEGGMHQVSKCSGPPALLGWATGTLPEPPNQPQIGMQNMRMIMPALQKAQSAGLAGAAVEFQSAAVPKSQRETKVVKDMEPAAIASEIVEWLKG
jgi:electron transfer flavoprotein beta subunit